MGDIPIYNSVLFQKNCVAKQLQIEEVDLVTLNRYAASGINFLVKYNDKIYFGTQDGAIRIVTEDELAGKIDKVDGAEEDNFASFTNFGGIKDSGKNEKDLRKITPSNTEPLNQNEGDVWLEINEI